VPLVGTMSDVSDLPLAALPLYTAGSATRGRYAPSPSGDLHLGNLRTALLAWLFARCAGGQFVLRIEDLDRPRVRPGALEGMLRDLRWLGLDWDEGPDRGGPYAPYIQSERQAIYEQHLGRLREAGLLYPCYCSRADIARAASAPPNDEGPRYPGTCRHLTEEQRGQHEASQRRPSLRFRLDDERTVAFDDLLLGHQAQQVQRTVGDFIVRRAGGIFSYQFAVVVDDALMRINQVVRGADLAVGSRYVTGGGITNWPWKRIVTSKVACMLAQPLTPIKDVTSGYFLVRRDAIEDVDLDPIGFKIGLEVIAKGHYGRAVEIPYVFTDRVAGESKLNQKEILNYLRQLRRIYSGRLLAKANGP